MHSLFDYDLIILSNLCALDRERMDIIKNAIKVIPYIKYEHDHRGIDLYLNDDFIKNLYKKSKVNIFVSPKHLENYKEAFGINGICIPPPIDVERFKPNGTKKQKNMALIATPPKINTTELEAFKNEHPDLIYKLMTKDVPHEKMHEVYTNYEYFIHLPKRTWAFERVVFEAALCGCKVVTNSNVQGTSWGMDLGNPEALRPWLAKAPGDFWAAVIPHLREGRA